MPARPAKVDFHRVVFVKSSRKVAASFSVTLPGIVLKRVAALPMPVHSGQANGAFPAPAALQLTAATLALRTLRSAGWSGHVTLRTRYPEAAQLAREQADPACHADSMALAAFRQESRWFKGVGWEVAPSAQSGIRARSSAEERLPHKQRGGGSTPPGPTSGFGTRSPTRHPPRPPLPGGGRQTGPGVALQRLP
jgi:hypothetical protein